jgi:hypothetical protein
MRIMSEESDVEEEESQEEEEPVYKEECDDFLGDIEDEVVVLLDSLPFSTILSSYIKKSGEHRLDFYYCGSLSEVKERLLGILKLDSVVVESFISNESIAKSLGVDVNKETYTYDGASVLFIFVPNPQSGTSIDDKDIDVFAIDVW